MLASWFISNKEESVKQITKEIALGLQCNYFRERIMCICSKGRVTSSFLDKLSYYGIPGRMETIHFFIFLGHFLRSFTCIVEQVKRLWKYFFLKSILKFLTREFK